MKRTIISFIGVLLLSGNLTAQGNMQRRHHVTYEQMTEKMVKELKLDEKQQKYDKAIGKILTEQQYEGYQKIKPQFYSQRKNREFLFGGQSLGQGMPMPPGGMGGPGSRNQNITYSGATELKTSATETDKTFF